jgi:hypothetical protein
VFVLLAGGAPVALSSVLVYENWDAGGLGWYAAPGAAVRIADDVNLAGTERELDYYDFTVYAEAGTAPYTVTSQLYRDSFGLPGDAIAGTFCTHLVTVDGVVVLECAPGTGATLPDTLWVVLSFSDANAGWPIAEAAELGYTDDVYADDFMGFWEALWFGGPPEYPYAGFDAFIWCKSGCEKGDDINPGFDYWSCPDANFAFGGGGGGCLPPVPADFFGPGSDPFDGIIYCTGETPEPVPHPDTVVQRTSQGHVPPPYPSSDTIDIEIIALSLVSVAPITVTQNGGQDPEQWDVEVDLSGIPAPPGTLDATKTHCNGGTYTSDLPVQPRFTFTKVGGPGETRVLDTGLEGLEPIDFNSIGPCPWEHSPDGNDFRPSPLCPLVLEDSGCSMTLVALPMTQDEFWVLVDPFGEASGGGTGYNGGQWYYYENTDWWNEWFYDHPFDPDRKKVIDVSFTIVPFDPCIPSWATVAYNWSTPDWPDPCRPPLPPLDPCDEDVFIGRSILFEDDLAIWPQFVQHHFEIEDYNPAWISIDVNGFNYEIIDGWIEHACLPKLELDFGDAPDPNYPTLLASDGARHVISGPYFCDPAGGDAPDPEPDGQPHPWATGDDTDGNDDEDGVNFPLLVVGQPGIVSLNVCGGGIVEIWIDYNGDEDWDDASEFEFSGYMGNGPNTIVVNPPAGSVTGQTFARCRISTAGIGSPTGLASDGEVEDHMVEIIPPPTCWDNITQCAGQSRGDGTCSGQINLADLFALKAHFGKCAPWLPSECCSDYNQSGCINLADLFVLKANFGTGPYVPSTLNQNCP